MRKIETAFYSGLIIGAYLLSGCKPEDSGIPVSLDKGPEKSTTPPSTLVLPTTAEAGNLPEQTIDRIVYMANPYNLDSQSGLPKWEWKKKKDLVILSDASKGGLTVWVIDGRKKRTLLEEIPDAKKIIERIMSLDPDILGKLQESDKKVINEYLRRTGVRPSDLPPDDKTIKIVIVDENTLTQWADYPMAGFAFLSTTYLDPAIVPKFYPDHSLSWFLGHELTHLIGPALMGVEVNSYQDPEQQQRIDDFTEKYLSGLTTTRGEKTTADSCIVHQSQYGETVEQIIAAYGGRFEVEKMFYKRSLQGSYPYKGKPNTAGPTTRLGESWQITLCPK